MRLHGCGTALVTPFRRDGSLDEPALRSLVAWQVESGIDFLVPCGTTGETPTLTREEWLRVIQITVEIAGGRVPVVAGATSNSTADAMEKAKAVAATPGVDVILTASPYYNKPTQEGQFQHFQAIAAAVRKPLLLYNVPGRTGANIEPATLARLAQIPNIIGVKEASGNISQIAEVFNAVAEDIRGSSPVYQVPAEEKADFKKTLSTLREQLAPVASPRAAQLLKQLDEIARHFG